MMKGLVLFLVLSLSFTATFAEEKPGDSEDFSASDFLETLENEEGVPADAGAEGGEGAAGGFPPRHDLISLSALFPDNPDQVFPGGKPVELLIGFENDAADTFNMSAAIAFIRDKETLAHIQNFTLADFNVPVESGSEGTFSYKFTPAEQLEPGPYHLEIVAFYQDAKSKYYSDSPFNATVTLTDSGLFLDSKTFLAVAAAIGAAIFFAYQSLFKTKKVRRSAQAAADSDDSEWLKNSNIKAKGSKRN